MNNNFLSDQVSLFIFPYLYSWIIWWHPIITFLLNSLIFEGLFISKFIRFSYNFSKCHLTMVMLFYNPFLLLKKVGLKRLTSTEKNFLKITLPLKFTTRFLEVRESTGRSRFPSGNLNQQHRRSSLSKLLFGRSSNRKLNTLFANYLSRYRAKGIRFVGQGPYKTIESTFYRYPYLHVAWL